MTEQQAEKDDCTCTWYVVDYSDPERYHPENLDREDDPACPIHGSSLPTGLHACEGCGIELDGDDRNTRCDECQPPGEGDRRG